MAIELNKGQVDLKVKLMSILFALGLSFVLCVLDIFAFYATQLKFFIACSQSTENQKGLNIYVYVCS